MGDRFGWSVDVLDDGTTRVAAVGAPYAGDDDAGEVHIFADSGNGWAAITGLPGLDTEVYGQVQGDEFGFSVAMSLRSSGLATLVVGAPGADDDRGAVYVYTAENMGKASTNGFSLSQRLTADDGPSLYNGQRSRGDRFGCSVAMDEDDIVIGVCGAADRPRRRDATPERASSKMSVTASPTSISACRR